MNSTFFVVDGAALLADLDADQRRAVTTDSRLVAVVAGAGSGKTRVLTRRVAYRVLAGTADARHTLVLTFTREAAAELRRRLPRLGIETGTVAGTFHSVCRQLLHQRWTDLGERAPTLRNDRARILGSLTSGNDAQLVIQEVELACSRGWHGTDFVDATRSGRHRSSADPDAVAQVIDAYHAEKRQRGIIDVDDLVRLVVEALERDREFAAATRWKFRHVLVDEAQDLNPLQHRLIDGLRSGVDDLFLVGDPAQAIYGFTGSDPTLLTDVSSRFPGVEVVRLPSNHRSTPQVVDAGRQVLSASGQLADIAATRDHGATVTTTAFDDADAEARGIAAIVATVDPHLVRGGRVAVLARTHAVLEPVRAALRDEGVPVRQVADGPGSALAPHLNQLYRFADPHQIRTWAQDHREIVDDTGDEQLGAVVRAALDFLRERPTGSGADFEAWVDSVNPFDDETNGVEVLTFHASKGREWHTVICAGCETGLAPHRSASTKDRQLEEARLLYVALTRATDRLEVTWARRRGGYQRKPTPWLDGWTSEGERFVAPAMAAPTLPDREQRLRRLREWRDDTARKASVLPDRLLPDRTLSAIADEQPATAAELDDLTGIGRITAGELFPGINDALNPRSAL